MFSYQKRVKLEINNRKICGNSLKHLEIEKTFLNNPRGKESQEKFKNILN